MAGLNLRGICRSVGGNSYRFATCIAEREETAEETFYVFILRILVFWASIPAKGNEPGVYMTPIYRQVKILHLALIAITASRLLM